MSFNHAATEYEVRTSKDRTPMNAVSAMGLTLRVLSKVISSVLMWNWLHKDSVSDLVDLDLYMTVSMCTEK